MLHPLLQQEFPRGFRHVIKFLPLTMPTFRWKFSSDLKIILLKTKNISTATHSIDD